MSGPGRDDWDDRRLDMAFQTSFDRPVPGYLRERVAQDAAAPSAQAPLLRSFRALSRTAVAMIAVFVAIIATIGIGGIGPTLPTASATAPATALPTTPPLIGTVGPPFPSSIRPSGSDAAYAVLSVADAAEIRDRGVDDREIAVAGWYVPLEPVPCALAADEFQPLEDCALNTSWLLLRPNSVRALDPFASPSEPAIHPVTNSAPATGLRTPTAVVFVGHFDDFRSAQCPTGERRQRCQDRFVVDTVAWEEEASLIGFPAAIDTMPVRSVSDAILVRESDLPTEIAVGGWYVAPPEMWCPFVPASALFLDDDCTTSGSWLGQSATTRTGPPNDGSTVSRALGEPNGPAVNPVFVANTRPADVLHVPGGGAGIPLRMILIGHFNDVRSSLCSRVTPSVCIGRFVVDAVPWVDGVERALPERSDSRAHGTPAPFDPATRVREVAPATGQVLSVAAMTGADLVHIEPRFDLAVLGEPSEGSFWIVTSILSGSATPEIVTFVVDEQGAVFSDVGSGFVLIGIRGTSPGPT
jgi:hypothetical protein